MTQQHQGDPGLLARTWQRIVHAFTSGPHPRDEIPGDGANTTLFGGLPTEVGGAESTVDQGAFWDSRDDSSVFPDLVKDRKSKSGADKM